MNNSSNGTATGDDFEQELRLALQILYISHLFLIVFGATLNFILLLSILTSQKLRAKFSNQLICNLLILHITESLVTAPLISAYCIKSLNVPFDSFNFDDFCPHIAAITNTDKIISFVADWLLFIIVSVFLGRVSGFDPVAKQRPLINNIFKVILHILPWATSLVVIPSLVYHHTRSGNCFTAPYSTFYIYTSLSTIAPISLSTIVTVSAIVLRRVRLARIASTNLNTQLISSEAGGALLEGGWVYVAAVATSLACEMGLILFDLHAIANDALLSLRFEAAVLVVSDSRVILMVLPWLLLPELRERLRAWKPWYRPGPGIDLSVVYAKHDAHETD